MTKEITQRIAELRQIDRVLLGSTSGTSGSLYEYAVWGTIDGREYCTRRFGGSEPVLCSREEIDTLPLSRGYLREFRGARNELFAARRELVALERRCE